MPRFSESLFESIRNFGRMSPTEGRRQALQQPTEYQQMGTTDPLARNLGKMFGGLGVDTSYLQTAPERIAAETKGLDMSKPMDVARAMLMRARYIQDPQAQAAMIMKAQEIMQADQLRAEEAAKKAGDATVQLEVRNSLKERATALGLSGIAKTLEAGGPLEKAQQTIREEEIKRAAVPKDKSKQREILAGQYGIPKEDLAAFVDANDATFDKLLQGYEGTPKPYLNKEGKVAMLRTLSKSGKVRDPSDGSFKNPVEMGLQPAPAVQRVITQAEGAAVDGGAFSKVLSEGLAADYRVALTEAENASTAFEKNLNTDKLVDDMFTGRLAEVELAIGEFADALGIAGEKVTEKVANTQEFFSQRGQAVLDNIKLLGAGSAISNSDREFMKDIVGQNIKLTKETIKRILRIERESLAEVVSKTNDETQRLSELGLIPEEQADLFMKQPLVLPESTESNYLQGLYEKAGITP
jgi:hypothetical protein